MRCGAVDHVAGLGKMKDLQYLFIPRLPSHYCGAPAGEEPCEHGITNVSTWQVVYITIRGIVVSANNTGQFF